jgi:hypothetical protein
LNKIINISHELVVGGLNFNPTKAKYSKLVESRGTNISNTDSRFRDFIPIEKLTFFEQDD